MAAWTLNLRQGVTELSREIYGLHMLILWVCVAIAVAVFGVMIYSIATFRKSKGAVSATFDHNTNAEVIWTLIPVIILVAMAIPAARDAGEDRRRQRLASSRSRSPATSGSGSTTTSTTASRFFSTLARTSDVARQLDSGIDPESVENYLLDVDNPLVVPVGTKVRVLVTSADVIHAWWVPDFGMKKDAIPGYINELWFKADKVGTYRGQCAELCGRDHGFMPIVVEVKRAGRLRRVARRAEERAPGGSDRRRGAARGQARPPRSRRPERHCPATVLVADAE